MSFVCVYCISTPACLKGVKVKGIGGRPLYEVAYKDVSAVASQANSLVLEAGDEDVEAHAMVLKTLLKKNTIVPFAYGMVFKDEEVLLSVIEHGYKAIKDSIEFLGDKAELGVKAIVVKEGNGVEGLRQEIRKAAELLDESAVSTVEGRLFSDKLVMNKAFLVEKSNVKRFSKAVEELERKFQQLKFQYTGPWPAYNFVTLNIG